MLNATKKTDLRPATTPTRKNPDRAARAARATRAATRRTPSPTKATRAATRRTPSPTRATRAATRRTPSPTRAVATRRTPSPTKATAAATRRTPSPTKATAAAKPARVLKDPYSTPFWPPTDYQVPAKNTSIYPNKYTIDQYKLLIEKLKSIFTNEKIIERDNVKYEELLKDQQSYNKLLYNLKPKNIVCFVVCEYYRYDKKAPRVFHIGNNFFGNFEFNKLLRENNMSMKRLNDTTLYIHKNRF